MRVDDFDALVIPGGYSSDKLRINEGMVEFTREFVQSGKPVAAICHAGWMLAEAVGVRDRRLTSVRNIRTDLVNAGADWVDQEVVVDGNLITSRTPVTCARSATRCWSSSCSAWRSATRGQPHECREHGPVSPVQAWSWVGAAQDGDLMAQHEELDILGGGRAARQ